MLRKYLKKPTVRKFLSALAITVFFPVLMNILFMIYAGYFLIFMKLFNEPNPIFVNPLIFVARHLVFLGLFMVFSRYVLKSKISTLLKAIYFTVPLSLVLSTVGILLYRWTSVGVVLGFLICVAIIVYLHKTKSSWLYYYATILVSLVLATFTLLGGEI